MDCLPIDFCLETERLRLRPANESDQPHVWSASRVPGFTDGMLWEPPERIEELDAPLFRSRERWQRGEDYMFSIDRKEDGAFVGRIAIRKAPEPFVWDIGFWTHPELQGQGYMTEACQAIIELGFATLNATAITACYADWNRASARVLEKLGMSRVAYNEQGFQKRGAWVAEYVVRLERPVT